MAARIEFSSSMKLRISPRVVVSFCQSYDMVWGEAFDATLQFVPVVNITGYSGFCAIIKLYFNFSLRAEWLN